MKKRTKRLLTASGIISAALLLASCEQNSEEPSEFDPSSNELEDVYGPPDMFDPIEYEPSENIEPAVYGPPDASEPTEDYEPDENIAEPLYGPPPGQGEKQE